MQAYNLKSVVFLKENSESSSKKLIAGIHVEHFSTFLLSGPV